MGFGLAETFGGLDIGDDLEVICYRMHICVELGAYHDISLIGEM